MKGLGGLDHTAGENGGALWWGITLGGKSGKSTHCLPLWSFTPFFTDQRQSLPLCQSSPLKVYYSIIGRGGGSAWPVSRKKKTPSLLITLSSKDPLLIVHLIPITAKKWYVQGYLVHYKTSCALLTIHQLYYIIELITQHRSATSVFLSAKLLNYHLHILFATPLCTWVHMIKLFPLTQKNSCPPQLKL